MKRGTYKQQLILSLCDYTGIMSQPYLDAGYKVVRIDLKHGDDVRLLTDPIERYGRIHGVIAQPPCTHLAGSGARWWESKGEEALLEAMSIVDACIRIATVARPKWWVLENPVGRLSSYLGPADFHFHPWEYALLADDPRSEAYTKKTCLWGSFRPPVRNPYPDGPVLGSKMHEIPEGPNRGDIRSVAPTGFARAFYEANR